MKKTYIFIAITIFCWSTIATTSKLLLNELSSIQVLWMSTLIGAVFLVILNLCTGNFRTYKNYRIKDYLIMTGIGLPGTLFYYLFYYSGTALMPASQAFIVNYLWPIMSVVFACIILKEKLTLKKLVAIIISFAGVIIAVGGSLGSGAEKNTLFGALYCILGAVSYGLFTALNQKTNYNKMMTLMASYIVTFIITTVINGIKDTLFMPWSGQLAGFMWNGIFTGALATYFWIKALEGGKTAKISNLAYITPFLSTVWTSIFLGLLIIIIGIFIQMKEKTKG